MIELTLSNSTEKCLLDDEDFVKVSLYSWRLVTSRNSKYVVAGSGKDQIHIHTFLAQGLGLPMIDHIDGNGLNNQRQNLRKTNYSANQLNTDKYRNSKSKYKGVSYYANKKDPKKWVARLYYLKKAYSLGCYETEVEAAMAYNDAIERICPGIARLNKIQYL